MILFNFLKKKAHFFKVRLKIHSNFVNYLSVRQATPGRVLPSRSSNEAPPPVETWLTLSSRPNLAIAVAVSPPPMMVVASSSAKQSATPLVP